MMTLDKLLGYLSIRKTSYQSLFGPAGIVGSEGLKDLARFCRAHETCSVPGNRDLTFMLEGRREVWLRIQQHLHLQPEELAALYKAVVTKRPGEE